MPKNFKPSKAQQATINFIDQHGYIAERDIHRPTRAALYNAGIIYYDLVSEVSQPDESGLVWMQSIDAFLLTEYGKTLVKLQEA